MQVILLEKVANLGQLGDVVKVKDGFARNYLIPHGKARRATPENLAEFEKRRAELEKTQAEALAAARNCSDFTSSQSYSGGISPDVETTLHDSIEPSELIVRYMTCRPSSWSPGCKRPESGVTGLNRRSKVSLE